MRLLDTHSGTFVWVHDPTEARYAILSHTWSPDGEQSYQELLAIQDAHIRDESETQLSILDGPEVSYKVKGACMAARADGYRLIWIDSCCIDKSSSAELSEAINSMFEWYRIASVCYAYLSDVEDDDDWLASDSQFASSRWHTRGWTLQELIAPDVVVFLTQRWNAFGTKTTLAETLEAITAVDREVLTGEAALHSVSVARRMSWASKRKTTRIEDEAYALMGIFGVSLPTIYGEGRRAFLRLQEEILRTIPDHSIFAWRRPLTQTKMLPGGWGLLASSPADYENAADITPISHYDFASRLELRDATVLPSPQYAITPHGIRIRLYAAYSHHLAHLPAFVGCPARACSADSVESKGGSGYDFCAILPCQDASRRLVALPLCISCDPGAPGLLVGTCREDFVSCDVTARTFSVDPDDLLTCRSRFSVMELCIQVSLALPHTRPVDGQAGWACSEARWSRLRLAAYPWCFSVLSRQGYRLSYEPPLPPRPYERRHSHTLDLVDRSIPRALRDIVSIHIDLDWSNEPHRDATVVPTFRVSYNSKPGSLIAPGAAAERSALESRRLSCACGAAEAHSHVSSSGSQKIAWAQFELQHAADVAPGSLRLILTQQHRSDDASGEDFWLTVELSGRFFEEREPP
ncbi:HET-domain-containing protein [Pilatotrama ljubarskyi]|nr:HET-domain-containing protein [Pilatotrama ljubarskyi]